MRTERAGRSISVGTNSLASSIILVCRPRAERRGDDLATAIRCELNGASVGPRRHDTRKRRAAFAGRSGGPVATIMAPAWRFSVGMTPCLKPTASQ